MGDQDTSHIGARITSSPHGALVAIVPNVTIWDALCKATATNVNPADCASFTGRK